ncbi:uncharacterized protein LOC110974667 isoform X2 [Acanthaster planci]|uniref:Uncharacterized protein LOC110974667 isoform X2 n=1 Tax=Acanthaster planci TaxID=133434 RepID=A0A8B7XQ85_ACAPL|nr:uncharacterized protein LOC110974667 isoform X2 [Acanthaster planci]
MINLERGNKNFATLLIIFVSMHSNTIGWKVGVKDQDKICYLYTHQTKTCFIQSQVSGWVVLPLHLTPTTVADLTTPLDISWFRRVKLRNRHALAVVNLLEGGRPPEFMSLSDNRTDLTIRILSEYDMSRNSFKARVGSKENGDYQNFVIESEPIEVEEPQPGDFVAINTVDYFTIPGRDAHFDWSKEGARHLPRNTGISHDGKRLVIRHYVPAEDSGVFVCDVYSPTDYFIAGRRFVLGGGHADANLDTRGSSIGHTPYSQNRQGNAALYEWETSGVDFPWVDGEPDLDVDPLHIGEIVHTFKNNGDINYALQGRTQYLACLPSNMAPVDLTKMDPIFTWSKLKGSDVIPTFDNGRYLTIEGGILQISSVTPKDSGKVECRVTYHDVTGEPRVKTYSYGIEVYTLPDFVYSVSAAYTADDCDSVQRNAVFKQLLGTHLQSSIVAGDASYEITDFVAICTGAVDGSSGRVGSESAEGTRLNLVSFDVTVRHAAVSECSMPCMVGEMDIKTRLVGLKLGAFFSRELEEGQHGYDSSRLIPDSLRFSLKYRCEEGYGLHASICIACPPGSYSKQGSAKCSQCPVGRYQPAYGAVDCIDCPAREFTLWSGAVSVEECQVKTVLLWSLMGVFGLMALSGLIVLVILYRFGKRLHKAEGQGATEVATVAKQSDTKAMKDVAKKPARKVTKSKKYSLISNISSPALQSELESLLESSGKDDSDVESQQEGAATIFRQTGRPEEVPDGTKYELQEQDTSLHHAVQKGNIDKTGGATNQNNTTISQLPGNFELVYQRQKEPCDQLSRSQVATEHGRNEWQRSAHPSFHDSFRDKTLQESAMPHTDSYSNANVSSEKPSHTRMSLTKLPLETQLDFLSQRAFTPRTGEAHFTHKHSSRQTNIISPNSPPNPHTSFPSHRQFTLQDSFQMETYPSTTLSDHPDINFRPSDIQRQTSVASPSQVPTASRGSSTLPPRRREPSFGSASPDSPASSRSSSNSDLTRSSAVLADFSDEIYSETEIGTYIVEGDHLPPEEESRRSSPILHPNLSPGRSSVAALIASYHALSQRGPSHTPSQVDRILDLSSAASSSPSSSKTTSLTGKHDTDVNRVVSESATRITYSGEQILPSISRHRALPHHLQPATSGIVGATPVPSPPRTPQREQSKIFTPAISSATATPIDSPPMSPTTVTRDLDQTVSEYTQRATSPRDQLTIPPSPPRMPPESLARASTPSQTKELSSSLSLQESRYTPQRPPSPVRAPSIQLPQISPKESLMTRRSSLMTTPSGRPVNPFKLQRLRRQSLEGQNSSHLTSTLSAAPHFESSSSVLPRHQLDTPLVAPHSVVSSSATHSTNVVSSINRIPSENLAPPSIPAPPPMTPSTIAPPSQTPAMPPPPAHLAPSTSPTHPVSAPPPHSGGVLPPSPPPPISALPPPGGPPLAPPLSTALPTATTAATADTDAESPASQSSAPPHPVAALIDQEFEGEKGPKSLTSEPVKGWSGENISASTPTTAVLGSVSTPPAGTVPAPPPPPPPPPLLED